MGNKFAETRAGCSQFTLVVLGIVPGDGLKGGPGCLCLLNLLRCCDLLRELLLRTKIEVSNQRDRNDCKPQPDSQIVLLAPQVGPAALSVVHYNTLLFRHGRSCLLAD